jgi:transcriptional regulator with XRE-family HTH domain
MTTEFSGDKLRAARHARGLTQAELAHRAHVRERQIIRWENGQNVPRVGSVKALARVLGVPMTSLFSDDEAGEDDVDEEGDLVAVLTRMIEVIARRAALEALREEAA